MPIDVGTRFDRYEILSLLGKGGMGEVYLAQDMRLGRKIALKLLPARFTEHEDRLRRFKQEAQAASALNHPNIITIYEIGQVDSTHFIATEFVEGSTLRRRMANKRTRLAEALEVAIQVAGALAAAHAAGIVHRDIKPENIMLRPDGYVKVLDFGLAKLTEKQASSGRTTDASPAATEREAPTVGVDPDPVAARKDVYATTPLETVDDTKTFSDTAPGVVLGTARYMSPEQARGFKIDARTDLFSLGVVFYEMVAGRAPFEEATTSDVLAAILKVDPSPLQHHSPEAPEVLEWIVAKALMKDREERYQTAKEMLTDLKRLKHQLEVEHELARSRQLRSGGGMAVESGSGLAMAETAKTGEVGITRTTSSAEYLISGIKRHKRGTLLALAALLVVAGAIFIGLYKYFGQDHAGAGASFQSMKMTRFTTTGKATRATISPDGKYVVHVMNDAGQQSLWVRQVATPNNVEIVPPAEVVYRGLTFSRDGNYIYYSVQERNNPIQMLYQVPVLGGAPRKLLVDIDSPITLSPDSTQLAFVRRYRGQGEDALIIANADGTGERKLASRKGADFFGIGGPAWSPDGKVIACGAGSNAGGRRMNVVGVRVEDGTERPLSAQVWFSVGRVAWLSGGNGLVLSAAEQGATLAQVWSVSLPGGKARKITNDLNDYRDMSLTADSQTLVTVQSEARVNIWVMPPGDAKAAKQITSGLGQYNGVGGISWSPDSRIVYVSRVSGSQDIWIMGPDGSNQKQLTTVATRADVYPTVSPDGRYIVFTSNRTGNSNIWRMEMDGGNPKRLTSGSGEEFPHSSPSGDWVVYTSTSSSRFTLWKVPMDGGAAVQLTDKLSQWPVVSPDGKSVACWYRDESNSPWRIAVVPIEGGTPDKIFDVPPSVVSSIPVRWMPDGRALAYIDTREGTSNIWNQPLDGGSPKPITDFKSDQIFWFDWSRDGKKLACSRGAVTSDVVLISEFR